jgi:hypothetical protein
MVALGCPTSQVKILLARQLCQGDVWNADPDVQSLLVE